MTLLTICQSKNSQFMLEENWTWYRLSTVGLNIAGRNSMIAMRIELLSKANLE